MSLYSDVYAITKDENFADTVRDILKYSFRDLFSGEAFYSAEDADSLRTSSGHNVEGAFCVWESKEIDQILGSDAEVFKYYYGVKEHGNVDPNHDIQGELKNQVST